MPKTLGQCSRLEALLRRASGSCISREWVNQRRVLGRSVDAPVPATELKEAGQPLLEGAETDLLDLPDGLGGYHRSVGRRQSRSRMSTLNREKVWDHTVNRAGPWSSSKFHQSLN